MAIKIVDSARLDGALTATADAIRAKTGDSADITFDMDDGFAEVVEAISEKQIISWHQCPQLVKDYLAYITEHPYSPSDYTYSVIANYAPATPAASNTKPIGKTVDGITFYNNEPNVATPFATANEAGTLTTLDRMRWINTTATNVRDLGGWLCDGGTVKYGKLIRGGQCSASDRNVLVNECGVRVDLNLRGRSEAGGATVSPLGSDIIFYLFDNYAWYDISNKTLWRQMIRAVFDSVARNEPLYFHCAAGADRTGTLACILEALLGMSQSNIDADYELTSFHAGTSTDAAARRRNEAEWQGLINSIKAVPLVGGLTDTFRNRAVSFAISLGFTADEINAFRKAMIDGTPETIAPTTTTYTVTNTLSNVTSDNADVSATQYQPYKAVITPTAGKVINSIIVTMGGVDITDQVFNGEKTNAFISITKQLSHCAIDYVPGTFVGQAFVGRLTADTLYTLDGATIIITMGGVDVTTQYYSNGMIAIPSVTGNLVITATAIQSSVTINPNIVAGGFAHAVGDDIRNIDTSSAYSRSDIIDVSNFNKVNIIYNGSATGSLTMYIYFAGDDYLIDSGTSWLYSVTPYKSFDIPAGTKYIRFRGYTELFRDKDDFVITAS